MRCGQIAGVCKGPECVKKHSEDDGGAVDREI